MQPVNVPEYAAAVLERLRQNGFEAWVVGGCVRDSLLGRTPQDWDVTTSALPEETKRCFADLHVIETGIAHGTVMVISDGMPVEVTTYRVDGTYSDSRHPDFVTFTRSLHEDLARRDFTVNAMAFCREEGLRDDFGGREDLAAKRIRCVGKAEQRFDEDALRILRALRFASVLEFSLEKDTASAVLAGYRQLEKIAAERVFSEWGKLLCGAGAKPVLLAFAPVFSVFLDELTPLFAEPAAWSAAVERVCSAPREQALRTALLFRALPGANTEQQALLAERALRRLRADNKLIARMLALIKTQLPHPAALPAVRRMLGQSGEELFCAQLELLRAEKNPDWKAAEELKKEILARGDCVRLSQLALTGRDLPGAGKSTGTLLHTALDAVLEDRVPNRKEDLLRFLQWDNSAKTEQ